MSPASEFSVSYDRATMIVSVAVCGFLLLLGILSHQAPVLWVSLAVLAVTYAYSPRGYAIAERSVIVKRLAGDLRFPLDGAREVRRTTPDDMRGRIKLWGNGGLFGYYGLFRTSRLGNCWWYCTSRRNTVVVITEAKTALFSPDDVEGFLAAIRAVAPIPVMPVSAAAAQAGAGMPVRAWIGAGVAVVALGIAGFSFLYAPGPPRYTLTPAALAIHDRFYPVTLYAADVDVAGIRIVDMRTEPEWRTTARTNGFANAHYRSGWFQVRSGRKIRLYTAGGSRLVLLPPKGEGAAVLLEAINPEEFVAEVRREWRS